MSEHALYTQYTSLVCEAEAKALAAQTEADDYLKRNEIGLWRELVGVADHYRALAVDYRYAQLAYI